MDNILNSLQSKELAEPGDTGWITIDGPDTDDRDDAIRYLPESGVLAVAITNSNGARLKPVEESRAFARMATEYRPSKFLPMLPKNVQDALTLTEGRNQYCLLIVIPTAEDAQPELHFSSVPIAKNLTYAHVSSLCGEGEEFEALANFSLSMLGKRQDGGALAVYDIAKGWCTNEDGHIVKIKRREDTIGQIIVQEAMIAANSAVASWAASRGLPICYRTQRINGGTAQSIGEAITALLQEPLTEQEFLNQSAALLGQFERARYSATASPHAALSLPAYTHATSPIRRYVDIVNLRQIAAALSGKRLPYSLDEVQAVCDFATASQAAKRCIKDEDMKQERQEKAEKKVVKIAQVPHKSAGIHNLSPKDLLRLMETSENTETPEVLITEVRSRAAAGSLPSKLTAWLLRSCLSGRLEWAPALSVALSKVEAVAAKSILNEGAQVGWWELPTVERSTAPNPESPMTSIFKAVATWQGLGTAEATAKQVKEAEAKALLSLLVSISSGFTAEEATNG